MTTLTPLDLRGLSLAELQAKDVEIGRQLDGIELTRPDGETGESITAKYWLADRRQIRAAMVELRRQERVSSDLAQYEGI